MDVDPAPTTSTPWPACGSRAGTTRTRPSSPPQGWRRAGSVVYIAETAQGEITLDVWRYEKSLVG